MVIIGYVKYDFFSFILLFWFESGFSNIIECFIFMWEFII